MPYRQFALLPHNNIKTLSFCQTLILIHYPTLIKKHYHTESEESALCSVPVKSDLVDCPDEMCDIQDINVSEVKDGGDAELVL